MEQMATQVPAHTPHVCHPTCLRLRLAQSSSVCAASSLPWRRYRAPKLRRVVLTVGLWTGQRNSLKLHVPQEPGPILTSSPHGALRTSLAKENVAPPVSRPVLGLTTLLIWNHPRALSGMDTATGTKHWGTQEQDNLAVPVQKALLG